MEQAEIEPIATQKIDDHGVFMRSEYAKKEFWNERFEK